MVSKIEKAIYNVYFCYIPVILIGFSISIGLLQLTPTLCLFNSLARECFFYKLDLGLIYHPLNLINLIFIAYNLLYLYYNIVLNKHVVGRSVKRIYGKTKERYTLKTSSQQLQVLIFCYVVALILSYVRFLITLKKIL